MGAVGRQMSGTGLGWEGPGSQHAASQAPPWLAAWRQHSRLRHPPSTGGRAGGGGGLGAGLGEGELLGGNNVGAAGLMADCMPEAARTSKPRMLDLR